MRPPTTEPPQEAQPARCRARRRGRSDDGSMSIEIAILFPALLLLVTAIVQYGLWFHARSVALAAAQEGAAAAASYQAAPDGGAERARAFLADHAGDTLSDVEVAQSAPAPGQVAVRVTGHAISLLPGIAGPTVTQSAEAPLERFTVAGVP